MNALEWDIERALQAHERQPAGRVVGLLMLCGDDNGGELGETLLVRYGPDKGRACVCLGWEVEPRSVRVRFPERDAVMRRDWLVNSHVHIPAPQPRKGPQWGSDWRSEGERWGDW